MKNQAINDLLKLITENGLLQAMKEIDENDFPRTRRIKYYKAIYNDTDKAYPPPLLIDKAYNYSVNQKLPEDFFNRIGKGSECFKFLEQKGFSIIELENDSMKENKFYLKRVLNQDIERTFSLNNTAAEEFFDLKLNNGEDQDLLLAYINSNKLENTRFNKRNTRNEHRFFPINRDRINEEDILLFTKSGDDYSMEVIYSNDERFEDLSHLLDGANHLLTDHLTGNHNNSTKTNAMIEQPLNQILYGPPGTGKTYSTITKALDIIGVDYKDYEDAQKLFKKELGKRIEFVTMHQSYAYEDFVQGLKPGKTDNGQGIVFDYKDGVFKSICESADENRILVKKEIKDEVETDRLFPSFMLSIDEMTVYSLVSELIYDGGRVPQYLAIEYFNEKLGKKYCKAWRDKFDYVLEDESPRVGYQPDKFREGELEAFHVYAESFKKLTNEERIRKLKSEWFNVEVKIETEVEEVNNYVIILDEINRCNVSKVFGELITLIEDDKRDKFETTLPSGNRFTVPKNLYIIGTMNTADKSISMVDIALRRRFEFEAMYPNPNLVKDNEKKVFMKAVNKIIRDKKSIDFEIGHSDFMKDLSFKDTLNRKTIPLLVEYFRNDMSVVKDILNECMVSDSSVEIDVKWLDNTGLIRVKSSSE
jgi:hypothetical protein